MSEETFLQSCRRFRDAGYVFLGLQRNEEQVCYLFAGEGEIIHAEQPIEDKGVRSIAQVFPLADFAERQLYRDCGVKAFGNINLVPREE